MADGSRIDGSKMMAHPVSSADRTPGNNPATLADTSQGMARPMTSDEVAAIAPVTTAEQNRLRQPHVIDPRRRPLIGRNEALVATGVAAVVVGGALAAAYVTGNENRHNAPVVPTPVTQEGQAPVPDVSLQITPNNSETQTGDPTLEIQNMLKADVNEFYNGTISLENPTFTAVDPDHPNNTQNVGLDQVEELCGESMPQDSHVNLQLTNALIASKDGKMTILFDGIVGGKKVLLKVAWGPQTVKVEKQGLFVNTKVNNFVDGDPVVSDPDGKPTEGNKLVVNIIDDQPNPAPAGQ